MSLPEYIEAFNAPTGSAVPYGIIDQIRGNVTNDYILNYVTPTAVGSSNGDANAPIKLSGPWQGSTSSGYWQVEFKNRFVFPTNYSLKGWNDGYYSKEWNLFGFNDGDQEHTLLSDDTSFGSTYCGSGSLCASRDWGTFAIKYTPNKAFRYFRITHPSYTYFLFSGIEFFGIFSTNGTTTTVNKKKTHCFMSIPFCFKLQTSLFVMIIIYLS
jgi:hypothetical protein